jgi:hypothetical protein
VINPDNGIDIPSLARSTLLAAGERKQASHRNRRNGERSSIEIGTLQWTMLHEPDTKNPMTFLVSLAWAPPKTTVRMLMRTMFFPQSIQSGETGAIALYLDGLQSRNIAWPLMLSW